MRRRTQASVPTFSRSTRSGINSGSEPGDRALRSIMPATGLSGTGGRVSGGGAIARSETGSRNSRRGSFQRPQVMNGLSRNIHGIGFLLSKFSI